MSVLNFPRLHFRGRCKISPATGNNDDVRLNLDAANVALGPNLSAMSDDEARAWMMEGIQCRHALNGGLFWYLKCGWNYFGTTKFRFSAATVVAVTDEVGATRSDDPVVGQEVAIQGSPPHEFDEIIPLPVICDLDPTITCVPQIFIGRFVVGGGAPGLEATRDVQAHGRWIGWRTVEVYPGEQFYPNFGATWQFAIPAESLSFQGTEQSPVLRALDAAAGAALGIVVQFTIFQPQPTIGDEELIARFAAGDYPENPVDAPMIGSIGVWCEGELETAPGDRLLLRAFPTCVGPATAKLHPDRDVVSLNLAATFPEAGFTEPLSKWDFGPVHLGLIRPGGGTPVAIGGPVAYDYATFEQSGGIVDVAFDPNLVSRGEIEQGALTLLFRADDSSQPVPLISESASTITVETDDRGLYLDVGERARLRLLVRERGGPPSRDVWIYLWEYQPVLELGGDEKRAGSVLTLVTRDCGLASRVRFPRMVRFPRGGVAPLSVPIRGRSPGVAVLALTLDGQPLPGGNPWETATLAGVRVLPDDDYSHVRRDVRVSWEFIYKTVWRYYHIVYPAMSKVLQLNDRKAMEDAAPLIVRRSDPDLRKSTRYMPPSRDLSRGKRELLVEWAEEVERRKWPPA